MLYLDKELYWYRRRCWRHDHRPQNVSFTCQCPTLPPTRCESHEKCCLFSEQRKYRESQVFLKPWFCSRLSACFSKLSRKLWRKGRWVLTKAYSARRGGAAASHLFHPLAPPLLSLQDKHCKTMWKTTRTILTTTGRLEQHFCPSFFWQGLWRKNYIFLYDISF